MPRDSNGVYTRLRNWSSDAANGIEFSPAKWDDQDADYETALNDLPLKTKVPTFVPPGTNPATLNEGSFSYNSGTFQMVVNIGGTNQWADVTTGEPIELSAYYTVSQINAAQGLQDTAIAAAQSTANAAIPAAQKAAVNGVASLDASGYVTAAQNRPLWANIQNVPATFAPSTHNHDTLYYTKAQTDSAIASGAASVTNTILDWDAITAAGLYYGNSATNGPIVGVVMGEAWFSDAGLVVDVVAMDGTKRGFRRVYSSGSWDAWVQTSGSNGQTWHPGNMPAANSTAIDYTAGRMPIRGSDGGLSAPAFRLDAAAPALAATKVAVEFANNKLIGWQTIETLSAAIAALNATTVNNQADARVNALAVRDVRLGASTTTYATGHVATDDFVVYEGGDPFYYVTRHNYRPLQKYVSVLGTLTWVTVAQV